MSMRRQDGKSAGAGGTTLACLAAPLLALSVAACAGGTPGPEDAGVDPSPGCPVSPDASVPDDGRPPDGHGFRVRVPQVREIPVEGPGGQIGTVEAMDLDWMCTLVADDLDAVLYVQDRPLKDRGWILGGIAYRTDGAWVSVGGVVEPIEARYDVGGNHRNDFLEVRWGDRRFRYYHSSFSINWRACRPVDCLEVLDASGAVVRDGCSPARTLPIACVAVAADGSVAPLVDDFVPCPDEVHYSEGR